MAEDLLFILIPAAVIVIGIISSKMFERLRVLAVLPLIATGILLGPLSGIISGDMVSGFLPYFATFAVLVLLLEMGMEMDVKEMMKRSGRAIVLTLLVFLTSTLLIGCVLHLLGYDLILGILLGAVLSGQDAAVMYPMSRINASKETKNLISIESALTDPIQIILVITMLTAIKKGSVDFLSTGSDLASAISFGILSGILLGTIWLRILHARKQEPFNYILTLAIAMILYVLAEIFIPGSGTMSVVFFGIVLGNSREFGRMFRSRFSEADKHIRPFHAEISLFVRSFFFVILGVMLDPEIFHDRLFLLTGALFITLMLFIRFIFTELCVSGSSNLVREKSFIWLFYAKGLASVVLATFIVSSLSEKYPSTHLNSFISYTFLIVMAFVIISGAATALTSTRR